MPATAQELKAQLEQARADLKALQDDLPRYEQLVADNERSEIKAKEAYRAKESGFEAVTAAKTAVLTARELLEQHQAELEAALEKVLELEDAHAHEVLIDQARAHASKLRARRERYEATFGQLRAQMLERLGELATHYTTWLEEEDAAAETLKALGATFSASPPAEKRARTEALLEELKARDVDVEALTLWARSHPTGGRGSWFTKQHEIVLDPNTTPGDSSFEQNFDALLQRCLLFAKDRHFELRGLERPKYPTAQEPGPTPAQRRLLREMREHNQPEAKTVVLAEI